MTSHDVVARVRRVLPGVKVGHAGTLDPDATGVLVICLGKATKVSAFLMEGEKEYRGVGRLGVSTTTQDASGEVVEEREVRVTEEALAEAAARFVGRIEQVPPMYSAVKVDGQKLYRLARKGVEVERAPRPVEIRSLSVDAVRLPDFEFTLRCSKGTYVRTLVHDLGEALGCGAHLASLVRTAQGGFALESALPGAALEEAGAAEAIAKVRVGPARALEFAPEVPVPAGAPPLRTGALLAVDAAPEAPGGLVRVALPGGRVAGVGRLGPDGLRVLHLFPPQEAWGRGRRAS
jgi:tRNA pseudouridine55 synthase